MVQEGAGDNLSRQETPPSRPRVSYVGCTHSKGHEMTPSVRKENTNPYISFYFLIKSTKEIKVYQYLT